ncbi:MAG: hypothetical protein AB8V23_02030 [Candidatus Midichloria sp.]|uniref:Uncharacterized protein n=1 Tax=Hyalomma marginatum TaxID=34627 RepID=A0A8S4C4B0_9ACAR|nr:hypothetical protein MHYMCMPASI_00091 [Hyalomma marginatum]CAG7589928.1 hypothetical protein MHYMCMPSP_00197 [Hyalomma marginatum]
MQFDVVILMWCDFNKDNRLDIVTAVGDAASILTRQRRRDF